MAFLDSKLVKEWMDMQCSWKERIGDPYDFERLFEYLGERPDILNGESRVLDVGCGHGLFAKFAKQQFPEWYFVGVDGDDFALRMARGINPAENEFLRIPFSPFRLQFADNSFDIVTANNMYDYWYAVPDNFAEEIARVTKPGGVYSGSDFRSFMLGDFDDGHKKLVDMLVSCGFEVKYNRAENPYKAVLVKK